MNNPFEIIEQKLSNLERLFLEFKNKPAPQVRPEHYTVKEAARVLKCSEQSIHNYIKKGFLKAQKVGRILLINSNDVDGALTDVKSLRYKR